MWNTGQDSQGSQVGAGLPAGFHAHHKTLASLRAIRAPIPLPKMVMGEDKTVSTERPKHQARAPQGTVPALLAAQPHQGYRSKRAVGVCITGALMLSHEGPEHHDLHRSLLSMTSL